MDIARISRGYCQDIARVLQRYRDDIARILQGYCKDIARILQGYCKGIVDLEIRSPTSVSIRSNPAKLSSVALESFLTKNLESMIR